MEVCALASGSSGNSFYVGNGKEGVLIDVGITCKQICERLANRGKNAEGIRAIFITHEHIDHVRGVDVFARKFDIPIYLTKGTSENCFVCSNKSLIRIIKNNEIVKIADMKIEAFSKFHHAVDPVSYNVYLKKKISIITDAGYGCKNIKKHISDSDFLIMEANHDERMLENGPYPYFLKNLIKSDVGHLSNKQSAECVLENSSKKLKNIVLSHLSKTNNTPQIALMAFKSALNQKKDVQPNIDVSVREESTELYRI
ncbi:MAG: MBL fold metallo-hydrolase [Nanoarchaeota archaeon]|nr:MBL fold metallo-hydrolase [Nanoarchaeota archaeon]